MMKPLPALILGFAALGASTFASADRNRIVDYARVTSATPVYRVVETRVPVENCWNERVREERPVRGHRAAHRSDQQIAASTLVGGLIGGAIGNAVGANNGHRRTSTMVGAVLGASIGNSAVRHQPVAHTEVSYRNVERCEVQHRVRKQRVIDGYDVTYRYHGQTLHTRTRNHPGKKLKIALRIQPLEH